MLLVEDNDEDAEFIEEILTRLTDPKYKINRAKLLSSAQEMLKEKEGGVDLVILDLSLPDSRGFDTFTKIYNKAPWAAIVVLTGFNDESLAVQALHHGAQDYIVKGNLDSDLLSRSLRYAVERKRGEEALRHSEARMRSVVDYALDAIITIQENGTIESFNPAGEKIFGYRSIDVVGKNINLLLPGFFLNGSDASFMVLDILGNVREFKGHKSDGVDIPLEISLGEVVEEDQRLFIAVIRDITDRKQAEESLKKAQEDLIQAGKLAVLGQVSAGISHELNQPLEAIQAYIDNIDILLREKRYDEVLSNFKAITNLTRHAGMIIKHIKNFARKKPRHMQPVSVLPAIEATISFLNVSNRLDGVEIIKLFPEKELFVNGETVQLRQVVLNIMTNSIDAMKGCETNKLFIDVSNNDKEVILKFKDSGKGFEENVLPHVFDPFFTTKEVGKGLGLGLSITLNIVKGFGGSIRSTNHPEGGAEFIITFPSVAEPVSIQE